MSVIKQLLSLPPSVVLVLGSLLLAGLILCALKWWNGVQEYLQFRRRLLKVAEALPGPSPLPLVGNLFHLVKSDKMVLTLTKMKHQLNASTFRIWLGPELKIIVTDPRDLEIVFSSPKSTTKDYLYQLMKPMIAEGLINSEGLIYRAHKNLLLPAINGNEAIDEYMKLFNRQAHELVKLLENKVDTGEFDCFDDVTKLVGYMAFETILGYDNAAAIQNRDQFLELTQTTLHNFCYRMMRPWLYPDFLFKLTSRGRSWFNIVERAHKLLDDSIQTKKQNYVQSSKEVWTPVIDFLIDRVIENDDWTENHIRDELITLFIGFYDTIQGLSTFALLMLGIHPEIQKKAREEVRDNIGDADITRESVTKLEYIEIIAREVMRLFPTAPIQPRQAMEDIKLTSCTVPKGCTLYLLPYATHRDPKHWEKPDEFYPEHFSPENSINRHPYAYVPFSSGLRSCPGSKYGLTCLKVIIAYIVRAYHIESTMKMREINLHMHISIRSANGYRISLKRH